MSSKVSIYFNTLFVDFDIPEALTSVIILNELLMTVMLSPVGFTYLTLSLSSLDIYWYLKVPQNEFPYIYIGGYHIVPLFFEDMNIIPYQIHSYNTFIRTIS